MSIKKLASLMISILLLVNPVAGVLAEGVETETVVVTAPDNQGNPIVTETVDGIAVEGNDSDRVAGGVVSASNNNSENTDEVSATLTIEGDVSVKNEYSQERTTTSYDYNGNQETYTYTQNGPATGIEASSSNAETSVTVEGNVDVEASGMAVGVNANSNHEGSTDINTEEITTSSTNGDARGIIAHSDNSETSVTVEGNVTVEAPGMAIGIDADSYQEGSTNVNTGDISVSSSSDLENKGSDSYGIYATLSTDTSISTGNVEVSNEHDGYSSAFGVQAGEYSTVGYRSNETEPDKNIEINTNSITAEATSTSGSAIAYGVNNYQSVLNNRNSSEYSPNWISENTQSSTTNVNGNIQATATSEGNNSTANASGILLSQSAENLQTGETVSQFADVKVTSDVSAVANANSRASASGISISSKSSNYYDYYDYDDDDDDDDDYDDYDDEKPDLSQKIDVSIEGSVSAVATSSKQSADYRNTWAAGANINGSDADIDITIDKNVSAEGISISGSTVYGIQANNSKNSTIDVYVGGNVTASSKASDINRYSTATGVYSEATKNGVNTIQVDGDVTATASDEAKESTYTQYTYGKGKSGQAGTTISEDFSGQSVVEIGGNVTAEAVSTSLQVYATGIAVTADGNNKTSETNEEQNNENKESAGNAEGTEITNEKYVNATGVNSIGIDSIVKAEGDIVVQADAISGNAYGVDVASENDGNATVYIMGGIEVIGNFTDSDNSGAAGIIAFIEGEGNISVNVEGDVTATTSGIVAQLDEGSSGEVNVTVYGDVTGTDEAAVEIWQAEDSEAVVKLIAEGTLSGGEAGIVVEPTVTKDNVDLTVWKVDLKEFDGEEHAVVTFDEGSLVSTDETKAIEQEIRYIIKLEANANGNIELEGTEKVDGYDTAKEGDNVIMKISADAGYHVTAAYNGEGQQVPLLKDASGNYYVVVPRGGGVYLSAVIDPDAVDNGGGDEKDSSSQKKASVVQLENTTPSAANSGNGVSAEDAETISHYSGEQQVAIILTKLGLSDALAASGIQMKELARKAAGGITSDLGSLLVEEEITIDGETAVWLVIEIDENGKKIKYCFRQLEDGTWVFKKIVVG